MDQAWNKVEKKNMTAKEYLSYSNKNYTWNSLRNNFFCTECGDAVHFVDGNHQKAHFRHMPSHEGHNYCPEYAQDTKTSKTKEALLRKKLFTESDISMNFEIVYKNGNFDAFLTIPPFDELELKKHGINKTIISIYNDGKSKSSIDIDVNNETFSCGEIKKIKLAGFPSNLYIRVNGKGTQKIMSYTFEAFQPSRQIYSYLISQNYESSKNTEDIDLSKINNLVLKKIVGKIYTGRHYIVLVQNGSNVFKFISKDEIIIRRILFNDKSTFKYQIYDVCFKRVSSATEKFCADRDCKLIQRNDAVIVWPPVVSEGDYKFYSFENNESYSFGGKMFIASETDDECQDIKVFDTSEKQPISLKISNINASPFYVTRSTKFFKEKNISPQALSNIVEAKEYFFDNKRGYLFKNGVLVSKVNRDNKIGYNTQIVEFIDKLEKNIFIHEKIQNQNEDEILNAIRYGEQFVKLDEMFYKVLKEDYKDNDLISEYLDICNEFGVIKKEALNLLMEV